MIKCCSSAGLIRAIKPNEYNIIIIGRGGNEKEKLKSFVCVCVCAVMMTIIIIINLTNNEARERRN